MPQWVERLWAPEERGLLSSRDARPGKYFAFVPDLLSVELPTVSRAATDQLNEALAALIRADAALAASGGYLNHLLIRSESISSSWIEGNRLSPKKLAIAELLKRGNRVALDVIGNVQATEAAIDELGELETIGVSDIVDLQQRIEPRLAPGLRTEQNFVGGSGFSPLRAAFVPPPETEVPRLVDNFCEFISARDGHAVLRAAIAHAQFETIHPFIDGNGRTGRALIHTVLRRSGVVRQSLIPISASFAAHTDAYIAGLTAFRDDPQNLDAWVEFFCDAVFDAARGAVELAGRVNDLDANLLGLLLAFRASENKNPVQPRSDSTLLKILGSLATVPVWTTASVASRFGISEQAAHKALTELAEAGILKRNNDQKGRLTCFTSDSHLALIERLGK